jgi:zinc D-Ala-D-Ala dipeptidase
MERLKRLKWRVPQWKVGWVVVMISVLLCLGGMAAGMGATPPASQLVDLRRVAPSIRLDIRYATTQNFTHIQLYSQPRCLLRATVAQQLAKVQMDLTKQGLRLKVYDCYRPLSVQRQMWKLVPDERYVANPANGSRHNRGAAVDLTLVDRQGHELPMPTTFDDFTERAWRSYAGGSERSRQNSRTLERAMQRRGFAPLPTEWWHFDGPGWENFPVIDLPLESVDLAK